MVFYSVFSPLREFFNLNINRIKIINSIMNPASSNYPEFPRKNRFRILQDLVLWFLQNKEIGDFYNLYGLDLVQPEHEMKEFQGYRSFMRERSEGNHNGANDSQVVLLRDKFLFYRYMKSNSLPVPEVFAVFRDDELFDVYMNRIEEDNLRDRKNFFVKDICGECASFVKRVNDYSDFQNLQLAPHGSYVLQEAIRQHHEMDRLNSKSINTLRIVTINRNGKTYPLTSLLRVGTEKTGNVDNWAAGGLAVGINSDGTLKERGFYKPIHGTSTLVHPDSGVVFSEFQVPYYQEAVNMACRAHQLFYNVRSIGWDVAIQEDGPIFIEGNDNWEISLQQACDRPLRNEWKEAMET